ncbi:type 2 periplasmic-binding domain-containing protein [Celerinatantimonas yamalensis]|uniref:Uncharacterized protein n=1 Tax=Celerinatantimonas yamalensis TaxID=559956 RepID=A0ABW9G3D2_9GAMM
MSHILVSLEGNYYGLVDDRLMNMGLGRKFRLTLLKMFAVSEMVQQSNYVETVLKQVIQ